MKDLLELYKNYLLSIQYQKEFGDKYGDTQELINIYEEELKLKKLRNERRKGSDKE